MPRLLREPLWRHLLLLLVVSATYESFFLGYGMNLRDEGWPLYAAMRLHDGGVLYDDVLWVFPPGHVLPAWLGYWWEPPGVVPTRVIYAGFNVALCLVLYLLGRRLMPPPFALLGALLLAVAAPSTHFMHAVFGYRYLLFSGLALLAFARRLRTGEHRWMLAAGACAAIGLFFRLTPAFAVSCGIGIAAVAADRSWRHWLRDWSWFAGGFLLVQGPVLAWFGGSVGVVTLWREVVVHPLAMLQALPAPDMRLPAEWKRGHISHSFYTIALRAYALLYLGYAAALLYQWWRCLREGRPFRHALLLAIVIWGGIFFIRSFGRADEPHLDSAIPPVCLLLAHLLSLVPRLSLPRPLDALRGRSWARPVALGAAFAAWVFLLGSDRYVDPGYREAAFVHHSAVMERLEKIRRWTQPGDEILDLTASPMLHVLSERPGPGYFDVMMPGTFLTRRDEVRFIAHLAQSPPALVIWPIRFFDGMARRGLRATAPGVARWVLRNYEVRDLDRELAFLFPKGADSPEWPEVIANPMAR